MTYYERNLPHWHPEGRAIFLTWRLHGSLPKEFVCQLAKFEGDPGKQFLKADSMLDGATSGPRWLSEPRIAGYVEDAARRHHDAARRGDAAGADQRQIGAVARY